MGLKREIALAIQKHEGYYPPGTKNPKGSLAYRNNNPGNLRYIGQSGAQPGDGGFARFNSYEEGLTALENDIDAKFSGGSRHIDPTRQNLYDFFKVYAPKEDNNNPTAYANIVAKKIGVDPTKPLASIKAEAIKGNQQPTDDDFYAKVDEKRRAGLTDTDILENLAMRDKNIAKIYSMSKERYNAPGTKITNDRELLNAMAVKFSGKMPSIKSNPLPNEFMKNGYTEEQILKTAKSVGMDSAIAKRLFQRGEFGKFKELVDLNTKSKTAFNEAFEQTPIGKASNAINKGVDYIGNLMEYTGVPQALKFAGENIGGGLGLVVGMTTGSAVEGYKAVTDKNYDYSIKRIFENALDTAEYGENLVGELGKQLGRGAPLGVAGKITNVALSLPLAVQTFQDVKNIDEGGYQPVVRDLTFLGLTVLGSKYAKGNWVDKDFIDLTKGVVSKPYNYAKEVYSDLNVKMPGMKQKLVTDINEDLSKVIRPSASKFKNEAQRDIYFAKNQDGIQAVIDNLPNIKYTNDIGEVIVGKIPTTLKETDEAIAQTQREIFRQYNTASEAATGKGLEVDHSPLVEELTTVADNDRIKTFNPTTAEYARKLSEDLSKVKSFNPSEVEDIISDINNRLETFYKNPDYGNLSKAVIDEGVVRFYRSKLDELVSGSSDIRYQELKNQYGALSQLRSELTKRRTSELNKATKGLIDYSDIFSSGQIVNGLLNLNPGLIASGVTQNLVKNAFKVINNPDRQIARVFENAQNLNKILKNSNTLVQKQFNMAYDEAVKNKQLIGGETKKGFYSEGANTKEETIQLSQVAYRLISQNRYDTRLGTSMTAWVEKDGKVFDTFFGDGYVKEPFKYATEQEIVDFIEKSKAPSGVFKRIGSEVKEKVGQINAEIKKNDPTGQGGYIRIPGGKEQSKVNDVSDYIKNTIDNYDNMENGIESVNDIVDNVEEKIYEFVKNNGNSKETDTLIKSINKYRKAQERDFKMGGRGDMDEVDDKILSEFNKFVSSNKDDLKKVIPGKNPKDVNLVNYKTGEKVLNDGTVIPGGKDYKIHKDGFVEFNDEGMSMFSEKVDNLKYIQEANKENVNEVLSLFNSAKGRKYNEAMLDSLKQSYPENFNNYGTITLYRGGDIRDGVNSFTINKNDAKGYSEWGYGSKEGSATGKINEIKVKPEQVEAIINGEEFLVNSKNIKPIGYKDDGALSLKTLKALEGRVDIPKNEIIGIMNKGGIKQQEKDLINAYLDTVQKNKVDINEMAKALKTELLPLYRRQSGSYGADGKMVRERYESVNLPSEIRGNVAEYRENIYESPIKTSAGNVHFGSDSERYFGHTRTEDMAVDKGYVGGKTMPDSTKRYYELIEQGKTTEEANKIVEKELATKQNFVPTRRVIEVQSDLYQKGRLEKEMPFPLEKRIQQIESKAQVEVNAGRVSKESAKKWVSEQVLKIQKEFSKDSEAMKLQQYSNPTAHFRMVREEVKKAAEDGIKKLQFPTGETAMKIEGLGVTPSHWSVQTKNGWDNMDFNSIKVGDEVKQARPIMVGEKWIITEVLGDGKFKAIPKERYKLNTSEFMNEKELAEMKEAYTEQFDISGSVDKNSPIYKFYEKELGRYLDKEYGAKLITDDKGVKWYEVDVKHEWKDEPVKAFGKIFIAPGMIGAGETVKQKIEEKKPIDQKTAIKQKIEEKKNQKKEEIKAKIQEKKNSTPKEFSATYYHATNPKETRSGGSGVGAFGRPVVFGDVAIGDRSNLNKIKSDSRKGKDTYIKIKELEDVQTPYGMGIFRVNDVKNKRYDGTSSFDIALDKNQENYLELKKRIGNNKMKYEIVNR